MVYIQIFTTSHIIAISYIFYTQILRFHRHQLNHRNNKTCGAVAITTAYLVEGKTYLFVEFVFMKESNHHVLIDPNWCPNLCPNLVQLSISLMEVLKQPTNPCHQKSINSGDSTVEIICRHLLSK